MPKNAKTGHWETYGGGSARTLADPERFVLTGKAKKDTLTALRKGTKGGRK